MTHHAAAIDVSVIIVNYNTPNLTRECVESVVACTLGVTYEIVLVDNGSRDTAALQELAQRETRVTLIKNGRNLGFAAGNNIGIEKARGAHLLLLNSDTVLRNNAISIALEVLRSAEDVGAVSAKLLSPDGRVQSVCRRFPSILRELAEALRLHKIVPGRRRATWLQGSYFDHLSRMETDAIWGTFFLFRRTTLQLFPGGRLPETFFMYGEDMEWCYLLRKAGLRILYAPSAEVLHYMGGSAFQGSSGGSHATICLNRIRFLKKYRGFAYAMAYAAARSLNLLVSTTPGSLGELVSLGRALIALRERRPV